MRVCVRERLCVCKRECVRERNRERERDRERGREREREGERVEAVLHPAYCLKEQQPQPCHRRRCVKFFTEDVL